MLPFPQLVQYGNIAPQPLPIKKLLTHNNSVFVLMFSGQLYVRGFNTSGQLGVGSTTNVTTWTLSTTSVDDLWVGGTSTLIRKYDGSYMFAGNNTGVGNANGTSTTTWAAWTVKDTLTLGIIDIALSTGSISVLLEDGTIKSAGIGSNGQLGNNTTTNNIVGSFVDSIIPVGVTPVSLLASNTMHGFIGDNNRLYHTGLINAANTVSPGTAQYTTYTLNPVIGSTNAVLSYMNNSNGLAMGLIRTSGNVVRMYFGGSKIFGQMADGVNGSLSNLKAFGDFTGTPYPSGTILDIATGYSYYAQMVITSTGIFAAGRNTGEQAGALSTGIASEALTYTSCVLPSGFDTTNAKVSMCQGRTYLTDGNFIYSSGTLTTYGGPSTTTFILDDPRY